MAENIFERYRRLKIEDDIEMYLEGEEPTIDEVIEDLFKEDVEQETYRVKVIRHPVSSKGTLFFPSYGYLRYLPGDEIQFWSFPGDEDSGLLLKDLIRIRADKYKADKIAQEEVWEVLTWDLSAPDEDDIVQYSNSGMMISVWFGEDRNKGLLMQILGVG